MHITIKITEAEKNKIIENWLKRVGAINEGFKMTNAYYTLGEFEFSNEEVSDGIEDEKENLAYENKAMANELLSNGYTKDEIDDICLGGKDE